jgi:hypothetical protein
MTKPFTARQGEFLAFIQRFTERHGVAPSFSEIAAHFGTSSPSVNGMIKTLERRGLINRVPGAARTLRVEVPVELLPDIGFGRSARRASKTRKADPPRPQATASGVAVTAAIAVLDALMPELLEGGASAIDVNRAVIEAARGVAKVLAAAGVPGEESDSASRRIVAEAARWQPDGRGVIVPRRVWARRR